MDPLEFLAQLQAEAAPASARPTNRSSGYHQRLECWVDDNSGVARVLRELAATDRSTDLH